MHLLIILLDRVNFSETRIMHSKSNNTKIMMSSEIDEIIGEVFESLLQRYKNGFEESMRGGELIFDSIDIFHYNLNKISLVRCGSYIDTLEYRKNKKPTINPRNHDEKCFLYAITPVLSIKQTKSHPERIFIDQYNWKEIDFHRG